MRTAGFRLFLDILASRVPGSSLPPNLAYSQKCRCVV
jgi:hypothetical protein